MDHSRLWVTKTTENKTMGKGDYCSVVSKAWKLLTQNSLLFVTSKLCPNVVIVSSNGLATSHLATVTVRDVKHVSYIPSNMGRPLIPMDHKCEARGPSADLHWADGEAIGSLTIVLRIYCGEKNLRGA